jgi:hypothetical protein
MLIFIILSIIGYNDALVPMPCVSPRQWEGHVHTYNRRLSSDLTARWSYDSVYQRTRVLQNTQVGETQTYYDIISLYQVKLLFYVDLKTGHCSRFPNNEPWRDYRIQPDAQYLGEAYLGSPNISGARLRVTRW